VALIHWLHAEAKSAPREAIRPPVGASDRKASDKSPDKTRSGRAEVTSNILLGSAVLAGPKGLVRLHWRMGEGVQYLSAGNWRVRNLRIIEKQGDRVWFTSATQAKGKVLRIEAGAPLKLRFSREVHFAARAQWKKKGELTLGFSLRNPQGLGLSIYSKGSRVPIRYELLAADGKRLQSGKMNYG
jgi:hypothetical protein